jgi:pimeloyl-ACP methyl ester carboxylesterase
MSIRTIGSNLIHYEVLGRGQPLIFIHGWLGSWRYWWPTMQGLSARHRSYAFDLWGFGDSSKAPAMYSLNAYVEMLDQFLEELGISRPVTLIGHALGGAVALRYALRHPDNVEKLVAVSLPLQKGRIHERLHNSDPASFIAKVIGKSNSFNEVDSETRKTDTVAMNRLAQELSNYDLTAELAACPQPTLLIFGEQDSVVQPPTGDYTPQQRPDNNQYYVALDNCNHFPMLQETAKFNRLLLDFIHASEDELTTLAPKEYWQRRTR